MKREGNDRRWRQGADRDMASKWLEERWKVLLPILARLDQAQEEQIKRVCEAELEAWRQRPSLKQANSLRKPLTQTRNRIRETFPVMDDNGWINPKSGAKEHLALKYLNFSTEEWMQMNLPPLEELRTRQAHSLPLANLSALLSQAEQLLQMDTWPEIVVGLGLVTGRGLVEVLHTGHFTAKSAYSVLFAGPMTIYEQVCDPFEVPTLVRADLVMEALRRLRGFFKNHFAGVSRRDMSRQCSEDVQQAIYRHVLGVIPLRCGEHDVYKQLSHGVYPRLATLYYCPPSIDEIRYMATIQNHRKILESTDETERLTLALAAGYRDYVVMDTTGRVEQRRGIRLGEPEVQRLSAFQEETPDVVVALDHVWTLSEVKAAIAANPNIDDDWDEEDLEVLRLSMSMVIVDKDGNIDRRQGIKLGEPGVTVLEVFQPRRKEEEQAASAAQSINRLL